MNIDPERAIRAFTDVLAVEHDEEAGVQRIVTIGDCYLAVPEEGQHLCPDRQYHDVDHCKHVVAGEITRGRIPAPEGWLVTSDLDERPEPDLEPERVLADGSGGQWTVRDTDSGNERAFDSRSSAEDAVSDMESLGVDVELVPPGQTDGGQPTPESTEPADVEVVDQVDHADPEPESVGHEGELGERSVAEDPLNWVPGDFIDTIDGTQAINRKGFEVLSHFYSVDVHADLEVPPEETDFEFCRVKAAAVTEDGRECEAYGSAHVDRGDDAHLLLEMADTRARKRALSIATGVGAVAVEELKNEVGGR